MHNPYHPAGTMWHKKTFITHQIKYYRIIFLCNGYEQNNHEDVLFKKEILFNSTKSILIYSRFTYVPMSFVKFWYFKQI